MKIGKYRLIIASYAADYIDQEDKKEDWQRRKKKQSIKCYARTNFPERPTQHGRWDLRPFVSLIQVNSTYNKEDYKTKKNLIRKKEERTNTFTKMIIVYLINISVFVKFSS